MAKAKADKKTDSEIEKAPEPVTYIIPQNVAISDRYDASVPQVKLKKGPCRAGDYPAWALEKAVKIGVAKIDNGDDWGDDGKSADGGSGDSGDSDHGNGDAGQGGAAGADGKAKSQPENKALKGSENK